MQLETIKKNIANKITIVCTEVFVLVELMIVVNHLIDIPNMLIETPEGYDFTAEDFQTWTREAGFRENYVMPLTGPTSAAVAVK